MNSEDRQRRDAAGKTAVENVGRKLTPDTKRMAGVALAALLAPGIGSMVDNQDETILQGIGAGILGAGGAAVGGMYGLGEAESEAIHDEIMMEDKMRDLKRESKEVAKRDGPAAGVEYFARGKEKLYEYIQPMDPGRGSAFNSYMRDIPEFGPMIADLNIADRSPRHMKHMTRGAMLGAIAAAPFAYGTLRGGEIVE